MTNSPNHDAALKLASTVGTNLGTLRKNKRALAHNLVMAVAVEGFGWTDVWAKAKAKMGFAKLEKPEQNQINVLGTAVKTIILAWPTLADDVKASFAKGEIVFSTLATSIKDAEKAVDKAAGEAAATEEAGEEARTHVDADHGDTPPVADRSAMIAEVAAMFRVDASAADFTQGEIAAMLDLLAAVDTFKQNVMGVAKAA